MSSRAMQDICAELTEFIGNLSNLTVEISDVSEKAAINAMEFIHDEQVRIFSKADFERDKKSHRYKLAGPSLIKIRTERQGKYRVKVTSGYDTETIRAYPELLVIEFGRPGISPRHSSTTYTVRGKERKKGKFPDYAVVMPIRAGYYAAKDRAFDEYKDEMFVAVTRGFNG